MFTRSMQATCTRRAQVTLALMSTTTQPEAWMRGPMEGIDPMLMPVAHALVQAREDIGELVASVFTYARGERLSDEQKAALRVEGEPGDPPAPLADLVTDTQARIDRALEQLRRTPRTQLLDFRGVGREQLPSNVLGLLFHAAEHSTRHAGQLITTAKILAAG